MKVTDREGLKALGADPGEVSKLISECFNEMIFAFGDVHCGELSGRSEAVAVPSRLGKWLQSSGQAAHHIHMAVMLLRATWPHSLVTALPRLPPSHSCPDPHAANLLVRRTPAPVERAGYQGGRWQVGLQTKGREQQLDLGVLSPVPAASSRADLPALRPPHLPIPPQSGCCSKPRGQWQLVLLDHGLYRQLDDSFRLQYAGLWHSLVFAGEALVHYLLGSEREACLLAGLLHVRDFCAHRCLGVLCTSLPSCNTEACAFPAVPCRRGGHPAAQHRDECGGRGATVCGHAHAAALGEGHAEGPGEGLGGVQRFGRQSGPVGERAEARVEGQTCGKAGRWEAWRAEWLQRCSSHAWAGCAFWIQSHADHQHVHNQPATTQCSPAQDTERLRLRYTEEERAEIQDYASQ